jgi:membrane protein involved in colicin uptake
MPQWAGLRSLLPAAAVLTAFPIAALFERGGGNADDRIVLAQEMHDPTVSKAKWEKWEKMKAEKAENMEKAKARAAAKMERTRAAAAAKAANAPARTAAAERKARDSDDDGISDFEDGVVAGKGKKSCPPGQTRAPSRGRGGDAGGCI